jgi:two-component system alkaline phosphatase synthesis response regulator PhoP
MSCIVVVEDDDAIRTMLEFYLKSVGHEPYGFASGEEFFEAEVPSPELCILDIMLPGMDGLEILRRLRAERETAQVPVLMLTARSTELDKVAGLESGADDYMVKPFGIMELGARVKALLRRMAPKKEEECLTCQGLVLDAAAYEVRENGVMVELTHKEFALLHLLLSNRGTVLTREDILQGVWGYDYVGETRTVDMHIKALRQKLSGDYIQTVRGVGYKFA